MTPSRRDAHSRSLRSLARAGALLFAVASACEAEIDLGGGPRVESFEPSGRVRQTVPIRIRFSAPVSEDWVGRPQPLHAVGLAHPRLPASAVFVDARTLLIEPTEPFRPAQRYRLALRQDVLGSTPLEGPRVFFFRTEAFGLEDARGWRTPDGVELALRFSHPVSPIEVQAALSLRDGTERPRLRAQGNTPARRITLGVAPIRGEVLDLELDAGLASTVGNEPLGKVIRRTVVLEGAPPIVDQVRPVQLGAQWAVAIDLASSVPPSRLVGAVRGAGPSVSMALSPDGPWILGSFSPDTTASLQIGPPLVEPPRPWVVELPRLQPALRILDPEPLLDLAPGARLEVEHHDIESLAVEARVVPPELVGMVADGIVPAKPLPAAWSGPTLGPIRRAADRSGRTQLDVAALLDGAPAGLILIEIRDERRPWLRDLRFVNRRGLDLVAKRREGYLWVRVDDLQGAVAGAEVEVLGMGGKSLARRSTDARGVAVLRWSEGRSAMVVATTDRRFAVLPLTGPYAARGRPLPELRARLVPDAVTYAPGQTLTASVLLADARDRPRGGTLDLQLVKDRGGRVSRGPMPVEARGTGSAQLEIPSNARPGAYRLNLHDERGERLASVRLDMRPRRGRAPEVLVRPGEGELAFRVETRGRERAEPVQGLCTYARVDEFAGLPIPLVPALKVVPVAVDLGEGEPRVVRCPAPPEDVRPWAVHLVGHTRDARSGEATRIYAPQARYADIGLPPSAPRAGQPLDAKIRVVDAKGQPIEGAVEVRLRPLEPRPGARIRDGGRLVPETLSVAGEAKTLTLALAEGSAVVPFVPSRGGPWSLQIEGAAERTLWVAGAPGTPRPLDLVLQRSKSGRIQAALPFPGRLLLVEEGLEVGSIKASLETSVLVETSLGRNAGGVSGLLLGAEGRWSAARLPPAPTAGPGAVPVILSVKDDLRPGVPIEVSLRAKGPAWSGVFRVLAVDASAAPTDEEVRTWLSESAARVSALDTLVSSAYDDPAPEIASEPAASTAAPRVGRPGRASVASSWLKLSSDGFGYTRLPWPDVSGRVRVLALVRAGGRLGVASVDRVVGDGLGMDIVAPTAVRAGDRLALPVLLQNGSSSPVTANLRSVGEGFRASNRPTSVRLAPGASRETRIPLLAGTSGALTIAVGEARVDREVARIEDGKTYWRGRGATASYRGPAVLPTPESLGAGRGFLVVGSSPITRFAAALQALLTAPPIDAEQAAATVLAGSVLPELTKALDGQAAVVAAAAQLSEGLSSTDPWLRAFVGHAALEYGDSGLASSARQSLAEVASSPGVAPAAAAYARLLLARVGGTVQGDFPEGSSRPDVVALNAAADVLLGRGDRSVVDDLPLAPYDGPRNGRVSPTVVNALTLLALDAVRVELPVSELLESALFGAARDSRWVHPVENALALTALQARAVRVRTRPYWGSMLLDGELVKRFNAQRIFVAPLDDRARRPEITVTGAGSAEVGLVLDGAPEPLVAGALDVELRRLDTRSGGKLSGSVREGATLAFEVEVRNRSNQDEQVLIELPLPAGLEIDRAPVEATPISGGYSLVVQVPRGGAWTGRFEGRAVHAGVWQVPPAKASLRHGMAGAEVAQQELVVEAGDAADG